MTLNFESVIRASALKKQSSTREELATGLQLVIFLYVDDLVTRSAERSKGYGKVLLEWLKDGDAVRRAASAAA